MAYIGNQPALQYITFAKQTFTANGSTVAFTLDNSVANENELEVFVNNVRQEPGSGKAYTASGTTLTMSEAPNTGDDFYCIYQGKATQTVTPGASTVTNAMLTGSIANAKLANSSITLNSSAVSLGGSHSITNTPAFSAGLSGNQACANNANTTVAFASEIIDTNNAFNNSTYTFTVPSGEAGNYYVFAQARKDNFNTESRFLLEIVKNNGTAGEIALVLGENGGTGTSSYQVASCSKLAPLSVGDTLVCKVYHNSGSTEYIRPDGTYFGAYKIIE